MDRIIEVKVCGNHLTKDSKIAGTKGESNITRLRITFDENWEDYAKQVVFWDAYGQNPVRVVLTLQMIEDVTKSTRVYLVPIPAEAMARAGLMTFSIRGTLDNKNQVSITSQLEVSDSPDILDPLPPTPSVLEQMQAQIEAIKDDLDDIETARIESTMNAIIAHESAKKAVASVGKSSYIGDNGNWYAWDEEKSEFYDTGVKAQGGSMVCVGTNPIDGADVWINTDEGNVLNIKNENGEFIPIPSISGKDGKGAYELAVENGYNGSMEQFVTLLNNLTYTIEAEHMSDTNNPHKVTAAQVGALPIEGGEITGSEIRIAGGYGRLRAVENYVQLDVFDSTKDDNNRRKLVLGGKKAADIKNAVTLETYEEGEKQIYHIYGEHNKPTAYDLGVVAKKGDVMTGPLTIDKDDAWGQLILKTPSGYFRAFETDDDRVRIDVRDEQDTSKRRYIDIFTNTAEAKHSHALRFVQTKDGVSKASYVLHTENINNFVVSGGSYKGLSSGEAKEIPVRKTTQALIMMCDKGDGTSYLMGVLVRGITETYTDIKNFHENNKTSVTWNDESVSVVSSLSNVTNMWNQTGTTYRYVLIG